MGPTANGFDFERDWPELRARVQKSLARWRVPAWLEEDIVQETGVRIWNLRAQIDPTRSVEGLAGRIAVNLLKDHLRRERFLAHDPDLSTRAAVSQNVENEVIARDEWQRVRSALAKLNPARRAALIAAMFADGGDRTPAAMRMMKMRARRQLRFLMEEVTKAKAGCVVMMQQSWDAAVRGLGLRSPHAQHLAQVASAAVIAVTAGALTLPLPDASPPGSAGGTRYSIQISDAAPTPVEQPDRAWEREIEQLAQIDRNSPKKARDRARKLFRVGPLSYGPGDSTVAGTVSFDPNQITSDDPGVRVSPNKLLCRVTVLRTCKERKKH